jgi:hypothetical protein
MFGVYCTVRLYVLSGIAPSAYMSCTVCLYVLFGVAPSAYMFDRHHRAQKLTKFWRKTVLHCPPIWWCTLYLYVKHGHDRLCWLTQKRAEKRAYKQHSNARGTESMSLVTRTPIPLEIDYRDLTNRVTTFLTTPAGNSTNSPAPLRRPLSDMGHEADTLKTRSWAFA